jgi:hypothetical protein
LVERYTRWFLSAALPILSGHRKVKTIRIVGGRADLKDLVPAEWSDAVEVHPRLIQADYAKMLRSAEHLLLSPGLGSLYECTSTHLQPLLQPGWNLSMLLQIFHVIQTQRPYPYVCPWEWMEEAVTHMRGQPEQDALRYLTGRIRDAIQEDTDRQESMLVKPIMGYLERDSSSPALVLDLHTYDALPSAAAHFSDRLRSLV